MRLELLTFKRRLMATSLEQYILKRQATLQIVVIRSRNLCIELLRTIWSAIIQCKQLVKLELSMPYESCDSDHGNDYSALLDQDCLLDLLRSLSVALLSIPFKSKMEEEDDDTRIPSLPSLESLSHQHLQSLVLTTGILRPNLGKVLEQLQPFAKLQCLSINYSPGYVLAATASEVLYSLPHICSLKCLCLDNWWKVDDSFLAMVSQLHHLQALVVCDTREMDADFGKLDSHPSLQTIKLMTGTSTCKAFTSALGLRQLQKLCIKNMEDYSYEPDVAQIPALHSQSKLTILWCKSSACIVVDFWDLISAPALMELHILCRDLRFTDHRRTAPPSAVAALERGTLNISFIIKTDGESSLQPELAIMDSCGMLVQKCHENKMGLGAKVKLVKLELARSTPEVIDVMRDVRRSADLPFSSVQLSSNAGGSTDDFYLEHALQQQAWHAEFWYHRRYGACAVEGPGLLSVL